MLGSSGVGGPAAPVYKRRPVVLCGLVTALCLLALMMRGPGDATGSASHLRGTGSLVRYAMSYRIALVADLDEGNVLEGKKPKWHSILKQATLSKTAGGKWAVEWGEDKQLISGHSEAGRGLELSELVTFNGELLTVDDRSGIVFAIKDMSKVVPRYILMEGDGATDKGQKSEWATVKDGLLYVGSFGKEYTNKDGSVANRNNLWVSIVDGAGHVSHVNWTPNYELLRQKTGTTFPGYMIHEAVTWSPSLRKWLVLPRRVSSEPYDDVKDEHRGSNTIIVVDEDWSDAKVLKAGEHVPERGFSSVKAMPTPEGEETKALLCLRSEEDAAAGTQTAYISILGLDGSVKMPEIEVPGKHKFEGVEFISEL